MALSTKSAKLGLLGLSAASMLFWLAVSGVSEGVSGASVAAVVAAVAPTPDDNYVGNETCVACHEPQGKGFEGTKHSKLHTIETWKDKVVGCESCHGPGKQHVEANGDKLKIVSFKQMDPKAAAETCLACHAGKESHNNFRRGEHWRNNVSCNTCHSAHGPQPPNFKIGSTTFVGNNSAQTLARRLQRC